MAGTPLLLVWRVHGRGAGLRAAADQPDRGHAQTAALRRGRRAAAAAAGGCF